MLRSTFLGIAFLGGASVSLLLTNTVAGCDGSCPDSPAGPAVASFVLINGAGAEVVAGTAAVTVVPDVPEFRFLTINYATEEGEEQVVYRWP